MVGRCRQQKEAAHAPAQLGGTMRCGLRLIMKCRAHSDNGDRRAPAPKGCARSAQLRRGGPQTGRQYRQGGLPPGKVENEDAE